MDFQTIKPNLFVTIILTLAGVLGTISGFVFLPASGAVVSEIPASLTTSMVVASILFFVASYTQGSKKCEDFFNYFSGITSMVWNCLLFRKSRLFCLETLICAKYHFCFYCNWHWDEGAIEIACIAESRRFCTASLDDEYSGVQGDGSWILNAIPHAFIAGRVRYPDRSR